MKLNVVFFNPAIIHNVGNIARTCYAFNADLHLIRPYGFIFSKSKLKRSSTNHFDKIKIFEYDNWQDFLNKTKNNLLFFYTKRGINTPDSINYLQKIKENNSDEIYLIFGNEQTGIPIEILDNYKDNSIRIPMNENIICLNVSNSVAIGCYEVIKQFDYYNLSKKIKK